MIKTRRAVTGLLLVLIMAAGAVTAWAVATALEEASTSRQAAEAALDAERSRAMAEAAALSAQVDDLASALGQLRGTNALLASDIDRLIRLNEAQTGVIDELTGDISRLTGLARNQSDETTLLRARVSQLSRLIVELGGQVPGQSGKSGQAPECDGPKGRCKQDNR